MKIKYARWLVLAAIFTTVTLGLILNTKLGTLSSLGWEAVSYICPLGALESLLASKSIFLRALMVLLVVVIFVVALGKVFCAWICPVAPVRSFVEGIKKKLGLRSKGEAESGGRRAGRGETVLTDSQLSSDETAEISQALTSGCNSDCSSCATKRAKFDSRHIILGGSLLSAAVFGFPVFCLICPIGLIFGTIIVVWQFIGADAVSLSLLVFPLILVIELVVLRKWCSRFCPLGALFSLLSLPNRFVKPQVNHQKCNRAAGITCSVCTEVCPELLDPHYTSSMHECSKCGLCRDQCPTGAISFALMPRKQVDT